MSISSALPVFTRRAEAAIKSAFVADTLAMPVHWFYRPADIDQAFPGGVRALHAAPSFHPSSIMSLHSTRQGGRASHSTANSGQDVVGDLILKGRRQFWNVSNMHYHQGMQAGDITLNAHCARVLMRSIINNAGEYQKQHYLDDYIRFMTADPPEHNDTYAESWHRGFFANLQRGLPATHCAAITHDTASIGGLVSIGPLAIGLLSSGQSLPATQLQCRTHIFLSHPDPRMALISDSYVKLIYRLLTRSDDENVHNILLETSAESASLVAQKSNTLQTLLDKNLDDREVVGVRYSSACYIEGAWPAVLYLAARYAADPRSGLIANTNAGGDNVHRGFVLGILFGLISSGFPADWYQQLLCRHALDDEIRALLSSSR